MPNVKVLPEDHKRIVALTGELMVKWGRKVYLFEAVKFLLDKNDKFEDLKRGLITILDKAKYDEEGIITEARKFLLDFYEQNTKVGLSTMH